MRHKIPDDKKRKHVSLSIDPRIYDIWVKYCKENQIENYSEYIEKIILEKIKSEKIS